MYADGDARKSATCFDAPGAGLSYNNRYQDTGYFLNKYIALKANNADRIAADDLNFNNNLRIYRYAETLLNAAELVQRGYGSGDGAAWLNEVHGRSLSGATVAFSLENIKENAVSSSSGKANATGTSSAGAMPRRPLSRTATVTGPTPGLPPRNISRSRRMRSMPVKVRLILWSRTTINRRQI